MEKVLPYSKESAVEVLKDLNPSNLGRGENLMSLAQLRSLIIMAELTPSEAKRLLKHLIAGRSRKRLI